jgi:hypothetical protein
VRKIVTKTKCQELVELLGFDNVYEAIEWYKSGEVITKIHSITIEKEIARCFGMG